MAPPAPPQLSHRCRRRHSGMSPGSTEGVPVVAEPLRARFCGSFSVPASQPAWLLDMLPFFDPSQGASGTYAKPSTCAESKGLGTVGRIEMSESVREEVWSGQ